MRMLPVMIDTGPAREKDNLMLDVDRETVIASWQHALTEMQKTT